MSQISAAANPSASLAAPAAVLGPSRSVGNADQESRGTDDQPFTKVLGQQMENAAKPDSKNAAKQTGAADDGTAKDAGTGKTADNADLTTLATLMASQLAAGTVPQADGTAAAGQPATTLPADPALLSPPALPIPIDLRPAAGGLDGAATAAAAAGASAKVAAGNLPQTGTHAMQAADIPANIAGRLAADKATAGAMGAGDPAAAAATAAGANDDARAVFRLAADTQHPDPTGTPAASSVAMASAAAVSAPAQAAEHRIVAPMGSDRWDTAVGNSLVFMTGQQQNRAELVLTPPHLGRVEISLTMNGDQANAVFISANPAVRDALENALPRLREILADAGVTLGQAQVGSGSPEQSARGNESDDNGRRSGAAGSASGGLAATGSTDAVTQWVKTGRGLVDIFA